MRSGGGFGGRASHVRLPSSKFVKEGSIHSCEYLGQRATSGATPSLLAGIGVASEKCLGRWPLLEGGPRWKLHSSLCWGVD